MKMLDDPDNPGTALTEDEQQGVMALAQVVSGHAEGYSPGAIRATFDGKPVVVVVAVHDEDLEDDDNPHIGLTPLALLLDSSLTDRIQPEEDVQVVKPE